MTYILCTDVDVYTFALCEKTKVSIRKNLNIFKRYSSFGYVEQQQTKNNVLETANNSNLLNDVY